MFVRTAVATATLLVASLVSTGPVLAQPVPAPTPQTAPVKNKRQVSITFSPVHLIISTLEVTGEFLVQDKFSLAVIGGYGNLSSGTVTTGTTTSEEVSISIFEVGAQARYYAAGDFENGLQVGAEVLYAHASGSLAGTSAVAGGLSAGPFVG